MNENQIQRLLLAVAIDSVSSVRCTIRYKSYKREMHTRDATIGDRLRWECLYIQATTTTTQNVKINLSMSFFLGTETPHFRECSFARPKQFHFVPIGVADASFVHDCVCACAVWRPYVWMAFMNPHDFRHWAIRQFTTTYITETEPFSQWKMKREWKERK